MQVKIGNGGGSGGVAFRTGGSGGIVSTISDPSNWIYLAAIAVLLIAGVVLIALVLREFKLRKKNK